ncbi:unnamed protein product [Rotaria sp. Silwood2]|nr:unnamed protein product [Rotaria sp. Silwood2]CAF2821689.1 unnamed protein product [Rotaria sp. Silwood2]CAF3066782.1 unnamed protein product [Rotaria sp. Silwood2]CAF4076385.1 unnamed protein product [Rotaria sp. Silwood2]CAF4324659.1 unnamed protein product [Rotaria sp. Silwood2]
MTATTTTTTVSLPKNTTGLFAGDTIKEVKSIRNQPIIISRQSRHTSSTNQLSITSEQKKSKIQQHYPIDRINAFKNDTTNNFFLSKNVTRTGFRPSPIRHQKLYETNSSTQRDLKDSSSKQPFNPSHTSNKLKSEIDHLNRKLTTHGDLNKLLRSQQNRDTISTPRSALSHSTYRISSASTNYIIDSSHQRYPSAITNGTINTFISNPGTIDISSKSTQSLSGITESTPTINEEDNNNRHEINHQITHAYQIPQQSNVGNESIFPLNSLPPSSLSNKAHSKRKDHRSKGTKSVSCPFYVMYFTNLAIQQQHSNNNENDKTSLSISATTIGKGTTNLRTNTSHSRRQSIKRHVNSPISLNTYSTTDDDDNESTTNATSYYNNKRFSARIAAFENENSHLLKDILRTTSWNHLQV